MPLTPTPLPIGARGSIVPSPLWGEGQGEGYFPLTRRLRRAAAQSTYQRARC